MKRITTLLAALASGVSLFCSAQAWQPLESGGRCFTNMTGGESAGILYGLTDDGTVSRYDGLSWHDIGTTPYGLVVTMCYTDGALWLAGHLRDTNDNALVQSWNGTTWNVSRLPTKGLVRTLIPRAPHGLYAGGSLGKSSVYEFDGASWSGIPTMAATATIAADSSGTVYVGGTIFRAGHPAIIAWDGTSWQTIDITPLSSVLWSNVTELYFWKGDLYTFTRTGNTIVRWDGTRWENVGHSLGDDGTLYVKSLVSDKNCLYAAVQLAGKDSSYVAVYRYGDTGFHALGDMTALHPRNVMNIVPAHGVVYAQGEHCLLARYGIPESVPALPEHDALKIFPNPAKDFIEVSGSDPGVYRIVDMLGREQTAGMLALNTERIDVHMLPPGTYVLRTGTRAVRFVK